MPDSALTTIAMSNVGTLIAIVIVPTMMSVKQHSALASSI